MTKNEKTSGLSHVSADGTARMVDVSVKPDTSRMARATGSIRMSPEAYEAIRSNSVSKGDVLGVARVAGIMAAKRCGELIPLCHPLGIESVEVNFALPRTIGGDGLAVPIRIEAITRITAKTGVEMEALTAVSVAALTIYDMCKAIDKTMVISDIRLVKKTGGSAKP